MAVWPVAYAMKEGLKTFDQQPIGTGPYMLQKWVHNQEIDLVKNPHWWNASATNGPFVDNIHMPIFLDPSTEWLAFQAGNIDFTSVPTGQVASSENMAAQKGWIAKKWPQPRRLLHRHQPEEPGPRRRQEPAAAPGPVVLGRPQRGHQHGLRGRAARAQRRRARGHPRQQPLDAAVPLRSRQGQAIVKSAWAHVPTLSLWYNTGANHDKILAPVQAGWQAIGIKVTMTGYEWATYLTKCSQGTQDQLYRLGWLADYPSMDDFLYPLFQSSVSGIEHVHLLLQPDGRQAARPGARHHRPDAAAAALRAGREADPGRRAGHPAVLLPGLSHHGHARPRAAARPDGQREHEPGVGRPVTLLNTIRCRLFAVI